MGAVYRAVDQTTGRRVAVKTLLPHLCANRDVVTRFFNEARAMSAIGHPAIVKVYDFGQIEGGAAWMAMELLEGESLSARLKRSPQGLGAALIPIVRAIAEAVAAAHARGVVHRDLKPDNVMLEPDGSQPGGVRVKVLDFGIAKIAKDGELGAQINTVRTRTGTVMGTPAYMSPEQCRGEGTVEARTDVYSLGAVIYHLVAGRPPFVGSVGEVLVAHLIDKPVPLEERAPEVPPAIAQLVAAMLSKEVAQRPTMAEVVARLDRISDLAVAETLPGLEAPRIPPVPAASGADEAPTIVSPPTPTMLGVGAGVSAAPTMRADASPAATRQGAAADASRGATTLGAAAGEAPAELPDPRPRWPLVAGSAVAALGAAVLASVLLARSDGSGPPPARVEAPAPAPQVAEPPRKVLWLVKSEPPGAEVVRVEDGVVLGRTPFSAEREAGGAAVEVVVRRPGYVQQTVSLDTTRDTSIRVKLERKRGRTAKHEDLEVVPLK